MKSIYQNCYCQVSYDPSKHFFLIKFSSGTNQMIPDEYVALLKRFIKLVLLYRPKRILANMADFQFIIAPDVQQWINVNLFQALTEVDFEKIAIIPSNEYITQISIKQTVEEDSMYSFKNQFFEDLQEAKSWLFT